MSRSLCGAVLAALLISPQPAPAERLPAVPLVVHDPYFSIWSYSDQLTEGWPRHWTNANHAMSGMVRIDGKAYRWMGAEPKDAPPLEQKSVQVLPTRTIYRFAGGGVELTTTFLTPSLPDDLDVLSRPVTYVSWEASSADSAPHQVELYYDCSSEIAVNHPSQQVGWSRLKAGDLSVMRVGTVEQPVLAKKGDDLRVDWGYFHLALPPSADRQDFMGSTRLSREEFVRQGRLPQSDDMRMPRPVQDDWPGLACAFDLGSVTGTTASRHVMVAYDDQWSIEYLHRRLRPYWRRSGMDTAAMLLGAAAEYPELARRSAQFDEELLADARRIGGEPFALLAAASFRQCLGAHKLAADFDGTPLYFSKENFSNGCIATVDVTYPSAPLFLLLNPTLLKGMMTPILEYAASPRWKFPFAPHDLGTYPLANGQVYGGGESDEWGQMPVEECGNMLIMAAALAKAEANTEYLARYRESLKGWADYLLKKGLDPENQLCTDDFMGHLAHNTNLSLKAILGIAGYGLIADMSGQKEEGEQYLARARAMAGEWIRMADDGDHYRLAFDKPGTWSQKYNLVWDGLLDLKLFPSEVAQKELKFYRTKMERYGLPLDNRGPGTKLDWEIWTASLAGSREEFDAFVKPIITFMTETPSRVPLTDWYQTQDGKQIGFQARSVVGGVYLPFLKDSEMWKKWSSRSRRNAPAGAPAR